MSGEGNATVSIPRAVAVQAMAVAMDATGVPMDESRAVSTCIEMASGPSMQRLADAVNARQKVLVLLGTVSAVGALTGEEVQLLNSDGDEWWLRIKGREGGVRLGKCDPALVRRELDKAGMDLTQ